MQRGPAVKATGQSEAAVRFYKSSTRSGSRGKLKPWPLAGMQAWAAVIGLKKERPGGLQQMAGGRRKQEEKELTSICR